MRNAEVAQISIDTMTNSLATHIMAEIRLCLDWLGQNTPAYYHSIIDITKDMNSNFFFAINLNKGYKLLPHEIQQVAYT